MVISITAVNFGEFHFFHLEKFNHLNLYLSKIKTFHFYRYSLQLDIGIHVIKVPLRFAGNGVVKCSIEASSGNTNVYHTDKAFTPDFVDGNLFSHYISIPFSNMNNAVRYNIVKSWITSNDFQEEQFSLEVVNNMRLLEGQVIPIIFKMTNNLDSHETKCTKSEFKFQLKIKLDQERVETLALVFRCRRSDESFLFTFLDHDGSVQQAAAVKPLKPCALLNCPVMLTLHGTGTQMH